MTWFFCVWGWGGGGWGRSLKNVTSSLIPTFILGGIPDAHLSLLSFGMQLNFARASVLSFSRSIYQYDTPYVLKYMTMLPFYSNFDHQYILNKLVN
jgi:hypothetical protein